MEDLVKSFLTDIISDITIPEMLGPNRYNITVKHEIFSSFIVFKGRKDYVWCFQDGGVIHLQRRNKWAAVTGQLAYEYTIVVLADPTAREKILAIFRDAD